MTTEIISLLIRLAIAVVVGILAPACKKFINTKTENEQRERIRQVAETAVYAAEQIHKYVEKDDPDGTKRWGFAHDAIERAAYKMGIALSNKEIDTYIQAAVLEVNLIGSMEEDDE